VGGHEAGVREEGGRQVGPIWRVSLDFGRPEKGRKQVTPKMPERIRYLGEV
jgi:hypothetical protein